MLSILCSAFNKPAYKPFLGGRLQMPFSPTASLYSINNPQDINYMHPKGTYFVAPVVFFSYALILEKLLFSDSFLKSPESLFSLNSSMYCLSKAEIPHYSRNILNQHANHTIVEQLPLPRFFWAQAASRRP